MEVTLVGNQLGRRILGVTWWQMPSQIDFDNPENRAKYLEYDLLIIPGGVKALEKLRLEKGVVEFVREWNNLDKTIFFLYAMERNF